MYICLDKMKMSDVKSCIYKTEACVTDHMGNINKLLTNHSMLLMVLSLAFMNSLFSGNHRYLGSLCIRVRSLVCYPRVPIKQNRVFGRCVF